MDLLTPNSTTNSPLTPAFGDNVQDLLSTGTLQVRPSAIITVNSIADGVDDLESGVTTLRDAINRANSDEGEDLIVFDRSLFSSQQNITLNLGELDITHNLSIIAPRDSLTGGDLVTVSGNNTSRVFEIAKGATVTVSGLIVADGSATGDDGGGIKNSGTLTLDSSIVRNNSAISVGNFYLYTGGRGGGIYNDFYSTLTVSNSTISGNLASSGSTQSRGNGGGIFSNNSSTVAVNNSTISGNSASTGGGIMSEPNAMVTLNNSTISSNSASDRGGGIYNGASMVTVNNSTLDGNSASEGGGGIDSYGGTLNVSNSTISGNSAKYYGGGIYSISNKTLLSNSTLSGNSVAGDGGGIYNDVNSALTVINSTISGNSTTPSPSGILTSSGGGIFNSGFSLMLTVSNSTISGNSATGSGGGIFNYAFSLMLRVSNSTISGNSAGDNGGGISNNNGGDNGSNMSKGRTFIVSNSILSNNSAGNNGGGIYNSYTGNLTLLFSTLTLNWAANGGGVYQDNVPRFSYSLPGSNNVRNTIIASNLLNENGINPDVSGTFTSNGYNLIGDSTGSTGFGSPGDIVGTSDNPIDPRLAPLDFNGGSTQTIALLSDSPAINAGDPTILDTDPTTDQRGLARVVNGRADIGAFEAQV